MSFPCPTDLVFRRMSLSIDDRPEERPADRGRRPALATVLWIAVILAAASQLRGEAVALGDLSAGVQVTPGGGSIVFDPFTADAFAEALDSLGGSQQASDSHSGTPSKADAAVALADGHGSSSPADLSAGASSRAAIPNGEASASSTGRGTLFGTFVITGGSGSVDVKFAADLLGHLHTFTDQFGTSSQTEVIFNLLLDGDTVLFRDDILSGGPNSGVQDTVVSTALSATRTLQYGQSYSLLFEVDSESRAANVPEPSTVLMLLSALGPMAGLLGRRARRRPPPAA